jgi:hypothetical protein
MAGASTYVAIDNNIFCHILSLGWLRLAPATFLACFAWRPGVLAENPHPKISVNAWSLYPTRIVCPTRIMGARRLPVGPSISPARISSAGGALCISIVVTFLPLAAMRRCAACATASASVRPSLRLAGTVSRIGILRASRNPEACAQVVQPLR